MRALLNKFEGVKEPPPPAKDRIQSSLDAPKPQLNNEAKAARVQSITILESNLQTQPTKRYVPKINPTDSDDIRELKRAIQAKEQDIMDMVTKLNSLDDRLNRVVDIFTASTIEAAASEPPPKPTEDRVKAFQSKSADHDQREQVKKKPSTASGGTSLAAILAAARSGSNERVKSERPKYAKILRDAM